MENAASRVFTLTVPAAGTVECGVWVLCCDVGRGSNLVCVRGPVPVQWPERRGTSSVETEDRGGC